MASLPRLYSDNDVAGMIYGPVDDPDAVLDAFIRLLLAEGWDVLGVLQRRVPGAPSRNRAVAFRLVPESEWPMVPAPVLAPNARASETLPPLAERIAAALQRKPDIVVFNRFGRAELDGRGLVQAVSAALVDLVPMAIAVPEGLADAWTSRTCGMAVTVEPDPMRLLAWWRSLGNGPGRRSRGPDGCLRAG